VLFNSYVFCLVFLPLVLAGWWRVAGARARLGFLTAVSYIFYGWWDWRFVPLMLVSTTADYLAGGAIAATGDPRRRRVILTLLLAFNLGILGVFKYFDFFLGTLEGLARLAGWPVDLPLLRMVLPVGISFYTFNSISYTIDIYRGRLAPARGLLEFSAFVAMFPHLVAGPIVRYADMAPQFERLEPRPDPAAWVLGLWFFTVGMAKKVLVADMLAAGLVDPLWGQAARLDAGEAWLATLGYTLQIYYDFSGYSDMAVGLAFLLGFRFPQNFDSPYQAVNISEFWRRWHMSLSFWMRDYLFIPLGGSRGSRGQTLRNLGVVMLLGGLWHGAAWTFVLWGLYHGALLAGHALCQARGWVPRRQSLAAGLTFLAVMVGWVLFRGRSLVESAGLLQVMFGLTGGEGGNLALVASPLLYLLLLGSLLVAWLAPNTWRIQPPRSRLAAATLALLLVACLMRFAVPSPFLYFQF
jgi:alginate O-acetyltransferase complex protein AlgI